MIQLREETIVPVSVAAAFDYTADFSRVADWDPGIVEAEKLGEGPVGTGTEFRLLVAFGSRTIPMIYRITEYEPPNRVVLIGEGSTLRAIDEITFTQDSNGTRVLYVADLHFKGAFKFVAPFLAPLLRRTGRKALQGLATALTPRVSAE